MKKIYTVLVLFLACNAGQAQYKKASFLSKSGRTYGLGATEHFLGGGSGTMPGIVCSFGIDQGKRFFYSTDIEILLPTNFKYTTVDGIDNSTPATVTGKTKVGLLVGYNFCYYLTDIETADTKFKPFASLGLNILTLGGVGSYQISPSTVYPAKFVDDFSFNFGGSAGLGCIYSVSEAVGIKVNAGYTVEARLKKGESGSGYTPYNIYPSHPYVGIGVRFTLKGED